MLEILSLTCSYGQMPQVHTALEKVSIEVPDGQFLCIVGPSGVGKSTLLRSIVGLVPAVEGEVLLNGRRPDPELDDLAVVFQDYSRSLIPWMTVRDNVAFPLRRMARKRRKAVAQDVLEMVGMGSAAAKYPWQLSGGMQQRVAIARALAVRPSLLVMDEPFGSVDAQTREELEDLILRVRGDMTILAATHDIDESVYVGDRIVVLGRSPGRVVADLLVDLPSHREQITTRQLPEFARLRAEVASLVRGDAGQGSTHITG